MIFTRVADFRQGGGGFPPSRPPVMAGVRRNAGIPAGTRYDEGIVAANNDF